ncbi:MAG: ATP-binding cassette domain-containing protein [Pseudomonadota bacterium]
MTVTAEKWGEAPPDELQAETIRAFDLDGLYEDLVAGRICGEVVEADVAQLILLLLERLDWQPSAHELAAAIPHFPDNFGLAEIRSALANLGFVSHESAVLGGRLKFCVRGTLVCDDTGDLWLIRTEARNTLLFQPGEIEVTQTINPGRTYRAFQFEDRATSVNSPLVNGLDGWSSGLIFRFLPEIRLMLYLTLFTSVSAITVAFGVSKVFDTIIPTGNRQTLYGLLIGLGMIAVAELVLRRIRAGIASRLSARVEFLLGTALFAKLLRLPMNMLVTASSSDQFSRLKQFETIREVVGGPVVILALECCAALMLLAAVALIAWPIALVLLALAVVFLLFASALVPTIRRTSQNMSAAQSRFSEGTFEIVNLRRDIRRASNFDQLQERQGQRLRNLIRARRRVLRHTQMIDALSLSCLPIAGASSIGAGAILVMQQAMTPGQLIAVTILSWRLFAPIQQIVQLLPKLAEIRRLFRQIDLFFKLPEDEEEGHGSAIRPCRGTLAIRNLVVRFPKAVGPSLAIPKLDIPAGAFVTVTGPSGHGKTTLLRVFAGTLKPQSGMVLIDEANASQVSRGYRKRNIAYVSQDPLYVYGTVAQNLRLSTPGASDQRILEVLDQLGLSRWVNELPDGINSRLDPAAHRELLGPAVRTMLGIARALLSRPAILLMDEPVGGLDPEMEKKLVAALELLRGKVTILLVTHRPSLIRKSDGVVILEGGSAIFRRLNTDERQAS